MLLRSVCCACLVFFVFICILFYPLLPILAFPSTTTTLNGEILCTITRQSPPVTLIFFQTATQSRYSHVYLFTNGTTPPSDQTSLHSLRPMAVISEWGSNCSTPCFPRSISRTDLRDNGSFGCIKGVLGIGFFRGGSIWCFWEQLF